MSDTTGRDAEPAHYRVEVAGRVGERWRDWFDADRVVPGRERTVLHMRVADQAELFGRLRRIHDLNLRVLSLERMDEP